MNLEFLFFIIFAFTTHFIHSLDVTKCDKSGETVCCAGYEIKGDKCFECSIGTYSEIGGNCTVCDDNFYGMQCALRCDCKPTERCDNVYGCGVANSTTLTITSGNINAGGPNDENNDGGKDQTNWMMYLSITVALVSFLIAMTITISKGLRTYVEKKASALSAMSKKEPQLRKTNVYGSYKKVTFKSGDSDDEYEFDSDNCTEDAEDQYASIRESQLVPTVCQYTAGNTYDTNAYTYNHLTRSAMAGGHTVIMATENYAQNVGKPFGTFQDD